MASNTNAGSRQLNRRVEIIVSNDDAAIPGRTAGVAVKAQRRILAGGFRRSDLALPGATLRREANSDDCALRLIGNSPAMQKVRELIGARGAHRFDGADLRRERLRQGARRRVGARHESARRQAVRRASTARRFRRRSSRPSSSVTSAAASPARCARVKASSSAPTAAPCCSTRSPRCRSTCSRACCACSKPSD